MLDAWDRQILGQYDIITSQYRLLMNLNLNSGQRLTTLSERLLLSKSTITRIVNQLETKGWVKRIADPEDRRAQRVVLTHCGDDQRAAIEEAHLHSLEHRSRHLTTQEQTEFELLLKKLCLGLSCMLESDDEQPRISE